VARRFLKENSDLYRLGSDEVDGLRVARRYLTEHNGLTHLTLEQRVGGIEVFQAQLSVHINREGAVIAAAGELIPAAAHAVNLARPPLPASEALRLAAGYADTKLDGPLGPKAGPFGPEQRQDFDADIGFARDVSARLVYFPVTATQVQLAWEFRLWMKESPDAYLIVVDAGRGALLYRYNLTCYDENPLKPHGLVYTGDSPRPDEPHTNNSPPVVERQDLPFHAAPFNEAATFGVEDRHYDWWATAAASGLISNNVDAHLDRDANNQPDSPRLATPDGNFSFPIDLARPPTAENNQKAAQVNLFYWVNRYHDILYTFGFTEAAGNFQSDNFGLGGQGNDAIQADAQDGSGTNNANFTTPPDGQPGRVQMFLWSGSPQLDGDLDQSVIIHELTHGVSNRLVGNATGLGGMQAGGMGEGWSDYFGTVLMRSESDDVDGSYPFAQYVRNDYAHGLRRYPYSTNLSVNPLTFGNIALSTEIHRVGEIWCNTLLEMRALLIKKYGFREGQRLSIQLVIDGLKLTPVAPTFIDARDAILLADRVDNASANQCSLWQAFAKRGMGYSASTTDASDAAPKESFDVPPYCNDTGSIKLDKRNYVVGELLRITLSDRNAAWPVRVQVTSSVTGDQETITLTPDAVFPGSFSSAIRLVAGRAKAGDGALQASVEAGDQITVSYDDTSTASGAGAQVRATAGVVREKVVFEDNVEQGNQGWIATGTWGITAARSASPTHCWTDSPVGNYANNSDTSITSPLFDLRGLSDVVLTFAHRGELEVGYDFGFVEYSIDDGATWTRAASFTRLPASFAQVGISLDGLSGQARARIRFRLLTDPAVVKDGWYIDDVRLTARSASAAVIPAGSLRTPAITSINPAFGPPEGGTRVTITGANFTESEDTGITFDGIPAAAVNVISDSMITLTAPPHAAGAAAVRVVNRQGAVALASGFTYFVAGSGTSAPALTKIFPTSGSTRGGTEVTLIGGSFTPETSVSFGSQSAKVAFINANTLRVTAPSANVAGTIDVLAKNGGATAVLTSAFNYVAPTPPTVQVLYPNGGETVFINSAVTIRWKSSDNQAVTRHRIALYRIDGAQGPEPVLVTDIATQVAGESQSFAWLIPPNIAPIEQARIRITAVDDEGAEADAYSSGNFTIAKRWEAVSSLPLALQRLAVASDGKYLYALGGRTSAVGTDTVATVSRFDPSTNSWAGLNSSPMPTGLSNSEAVYLNGKIYIPGGITSTGVVAPLHLAYDTGADSWVTPAQLPAAVYWYALAADESRGVYYLTGGSNNLGGSVATVRSYDPRTNAWSELVPMSTARYGHEAAVINGKLYVVGGYGSTGGLASGEVYDFEARRWSPMASLQRPRRHAINALGKDPAGNPLWFVVGGEDATTGAQLATAEVYDVRNDRWTALDNSFNLLTPRSYLAGALVGGVFYAVGGSTQALSSVATERARLDGVLPISLGQPPVLAVPAAQIAIAGTELTFSVAANDLGSGVPITITAEGLPQGAGFTATNSTNNSARGMFRWTPTAEDAGKSFTVTFTASDGQLSDIKSVSMRVVEATPLALVSAASYRGGALATDSLATAFGNNLAARTEVAQTQPLPLELAGTTVTVNGVAAPLFFVSPTQINFLVPPVVDLGAATVIVSNPLGSFALGTIQITAIAPAIFTVDGTGTGDASAVATPDGVNYQFAPFDVRVNGKANILVLYGTGIRHAAASNPNDEDGVAEAVSVTIGGQPARVLYAGAQGSFAGLDQINVEIPASLAGDSSPRRVEVVVSLSGVETNRVTVLIR